MVNKSLRAADALEKEGIKAEVVDLRTIKPLDEDTILKSVIKTGRLLIVHEAPVLGGIGGEIAAVAAKKAFGYLDAPIERVGAPIRLFPSADLEDFYIPNEDKIILAVKACSRICWIILHNNIL